MSVLRLLVRPCPEVADQTEMLRALQATDFISQVLVTLAVAFFSMHFGAHLHSHFPFRPTRHAIHRRTQWILSAVSLLLWLTVLLTFVLSPYDWRTGRRVSLSLVVAPPATWIRWWLAAYLNPRSPEWIKWGTFASNMLSTSILATSVLLQFTLPTAKSILLQCQALQSLQDGFSGCLSTIPVREAQIHRPSRSPADPSSSPPSSFLTRARPSSNMLRSWTGARPGAGTPGRTLPACTSAACSASF